MATTKRPSKMNKSSRRRSKREPLSPQRIVERSRAIKMMLIEARIEASPLTLLALQQVAIEVARGLRMPLFRLVTMIAAADGALARVEAPPPVPAEDPDDEDKQTPTVN